MPVYHLLEEALNAYFAGAGFKKSCHCLAMLRRHIAAREILRPVQSSVTGTTWAWDNDTSSIFQPLARIICLAQMNEPPVIHLRIGAARLTTPPWVSNPATKLGASTRYSRSIGIGCRLGGSRLV